VAQVSIKEGLKQMLNSSSWKQRYYQSLVRMDWEKIMGKTIARYTEEVKLVNNNLIIKTQVAPLKNELLLNKNSIIQKVNEHIGETIVKEVLIA
jgi:predicted nucleic acid-binding Zn ribbon protein